MAMHAEKYNKFSVFSSIRMAFCDLTFPFRPSSYARPMAACYRRDARTFCDLTFPSAVDRWFCVTFFTQINLVFRSLIRILGLRPKILALGKIQINLVFRSLIRIFAGRLCVIS